MAYKLELLNVEIDGRIATVTIDNPPVNVITMTLLAELEALPESKQSLYNWQRNSAVLTKTISSPAR